MRLKSGIVVWAALSLAAAQGCSTMADKYGGHRLLIWAIDKTSHTVVGFEEKLIQPGETVTLEPVKGYSVEFRVGQIEQVTVTDFDEEWTEDHIPFRTSHGSGTTEGSNDLASPLTHIEYGNNEQLASVTVAVPLEILKPGPLVEAMGQERNGAAEDLEDLLLAGAAEPEYDVAFGHAEMVRIYTLLGRTQRADRWSELLAKDKDSREHIVAAAVLMTLQDPDGTKAFCDACLKTKGNAQVDLIQTLCELPRSEPALATMVELIVSPTKFRTQVPEGVSVGDVDRRYLIRTQLMSYPREMVEPHADRLREWANSADGQKFDGQRIVQWLDGK